MIDVPDGTPQHLRDDLIAAQEAMNHFELKVRELEGRLKEARDSRGKCKQRLDGLLKRIKPLTLKETK